jgi:predicted aminopeptidase
VPGDRYVEATIALPSCEVDRVRAYVSWDEWVVGLRILALRGVVPIAEMAQSETGRPQLTGDPSVMANRYAAASVEHARAAGRVMAPVDHAFWNEGRLLAGQGFYVGYFAGIASRGGGNVAG